MECFLALWNLAVPSFIIYSLSPHAIFYPTGNAFYHKEAPVPSAIDIYRMWKPTFLYLSRTASNLLNRWIDEVELICKLKRNKYTNIQTLKILFGSLQRAESGGCAAVCRKVTGHVNVRTVFYLLHQSNVIISLHGIVLYWTVYVNHCSITPNR